MQLVELEAKTLAELQGMARELGIDNYTRYRKREIIYELLKLATQEDTSFPKEF